MSAIPGDVLTGLALCWRIERSDGAGLALTSHDRPIDSGGVRYRPEPGMVPAAITKRLGLEPHSAEASGVLSSGSLTESDLALGRWDGARVDLSAVDWSRPDDVAVALIGGALGTVALSGTEFTADLNGASGRLDSKPCPATSAECRASFGDKACRVDLAGRSIVAVVSQASGNVLALDRAAGNDFLMGRLRYLGGDNCGIATVVIAVEGNMVTVRDLPRAPVATGTKIELRHGCDKRFETCVERFSNAANFRGEPHLPGNDLLTRYPGA